MVASVESDRTNSLAAAKTVADLLKLDFGSARERVQIDAELAVEIIEIGRANKILKPLLMRLDALGVPIPAEAHPPLGAYPRRAMRQPAAAPAPTRGVPRAFAEGGAPRAAFKGPARQIALSQDVFEGRVAAVNILEKRRDFGRPTNLLKKN